MRRQAGETPAPLKIEAFTNIFTSSWQGLACFSAYTTRRIVIRA